NYSTHSAANWHIGILTHWQIIQPMAQPIGTLAHWHIGTLANYLIIQNEKDNRESSGMPRGNPAVLSEERNGERIQ
ncbi:hypothetical protein, partial [Bacteroides salyersiae]|uniref:hypothetical protein n=2 Tax=Bacteroides salyersiae TaxID=291644 RepID=UPI00195F7E4E